MKSAIDYIETELKCEIYITDIQANSYSKITEPRRQSFCYYIHLKSSQCDKDTQI